jgi:CspA family cold shock protein
MNTGTVKWYDPAKGYGFIQQSNGDKDIFVHVSALEKAGISSLAPDDKVSFESAVNNGKTSAVNVKLVG